VSSCAGAATDFVDACPGATVCFKDVPWLSPTLPANTTFCSCFTVFGFEGPDCETPSAETWLRLGFSAALIALSAVVSLAGLVGLCSRAVAPALKVAGTRRLTTKPSDIAALAAVVALWLDLVKNGFMVLGATQPDALVVQSTFKTFVYENYLLSASLSSICLCFASCVGLGLA